MSRGGMVIAPRPTNVEVYAAYVKQLAGERERGWQTRVARELGVHPSFISRIDNGKVQRISRNVIERAIARGAHPTWFYDEPEAARRQALESGRAVGTVAPAAAEPAVIVAISRLNRTAWLRVRAWADAFFAEVP